MKQVLQSLRTGELAVVEVPEPACLPGHVLVRNAFSFVSPGTERAAREVAKSSLLAKARQRPDQVKKVFERIRTEGVLATYEKVRARLEEPIPLGYSSAGVVIEAGEGVEGIYPGMRVACAGAGYANHAHVVSVPINLVAAIPEGVPYEEACGATLCAIAMQGLRVAEVVLGEVVGVIGLGLLGQITVQLLKASGCRVLGIDLLPAMVEKALELGADKALLRSGPIEEAALAMTGGHGLDAVILTAATESNDPIELAGVLSRKKGRVVVVGTVAMDIPRRIYYPKELDLRFSTSYGPGRYDPGYEEGGRDYPYAYVRFTEQRNMESSLSLLAQGKLRLAPLISHRFPIDRAEEAYSLVEGKGGEASIGILLDYQLEEPCQATLSRDTQQDKTPRSLGVPGKVNLGVIGAGQFASGVLLPRLARNPAVRMVRLATARGATAAAAAKRLGIPKASCRAEDVFEDPEVQAVLIATRHNQHAEQAMMALAMGLDVFVEKPLALNREELAQLRETAAQSGRILMVGFNRRFAPLAEKAKQWFEPRVGPLALLARINAGRLPEGSWLLDPEIGGGRIIGEVCHFVDLFQYWTGSFVNRVQAECLRSSSSVPRGEENIVATLGFEDGSTASLAYLSEGAGSLSKEWYEIHGGGKSAVLDDFRTLDLHEGGKRTRVHSRNQDKGHTRELEHFIECVVSGRPPLLSFESCARATEVTFEICEKLRSTLRSSIS
jgi:polar amino acid transport system substrate-binding protein